MSSQHKVDLVGPLWINVIDLLICVSSLFITLQVNIYTDDAWILWHNGKSDTYKDEQHIVLEIHLLKLLMAIYDLTDDL